MISRRFAIRVFVGMALGAAAGLALMELSPVPMQPGDTLEVRLLSGETVYLRLGEKREPEVPRQVRPSGEPVEPPTVAFRMPVAFVGEPLAEARDRFARGLGLPVEEVRLANRKATPLKPPATEALSVGGELFLRLLRLIVLPLIFVSLVLGVTRIGDFRKVGRIGRQTLGFFFFTLAIAATIGIVLVDLIRPGRGFPPGVLGQAGDLGIEAAKVSDLVLRLVPPNPFRAFADFDVIGVIFFALLLGLAALKVGRELARPFLELIETLYEIVLVMVGWVMAVAPIGIACLIASTFAIQDRTFLGGLLQSLGLYALTLVAGFALHFGVYLLLVKFVARYSVVDFLKYVAPAMVTAFGTSSSNATLPVTLAGTLDMGVSRRIAGFVVPIGATMNMDGTALFEAVAVLFLAQAYGVELSLGQQIVVGLTAILAAVGAAGIPSAGLVTMAIVLTAVGLPLTGIGLLFMVDRPLDMMRTMINVTGDSLTSRVVQTWNPDIRPEDDEQEAP